MIEKYDLTVVNTELICSGKWTRISTTNQTQKSILDYVICMSPLKYYIQQMIIDEENYRLKGKNPSDHYNHANNKQGIKPKEQTKQNMESK